MFGAHEAASQWTDNIYTSVKKQFTRIINRSRMEESCKTFSSMQLYLES